MLEPIDTTTFAEIRAAIEARTGRPLETAPPAESEADLIAASRERDRMQQLTWAASFSEVGERFRERTFATFRISDDNVTAYHAALEVAAMNRLGLGLAGKPGRGKTHLAGAIVNAAAETGRIGVCVPVHRLLARIRDSYRDQRAQLEPGERDHLGVSELAIVRRCATVPILALDDLGAESITAWSVQMLFAIVDSRYEANLGLVVTSNYDLPDLERVYTHDAAGRPRPGIDPIRAEALFDRIGEMTGVPWISVGGDSQRWSA